MSVFVGHVTFTERDVYVAAWCNPSNVFSETETRDQRNMAPLHAKLFLNLFETSTRRLRSTAALLVR